MLNSKKKIEIFIMDNYGENLKDLKLDIDNVIKDLSMTQPNVDWLQRLNNLNFLYEISELLKDD